MRIKIYNIIVAISSLLLLLLYIYIFGIVCVNSIYSIHIAVYAVGIEEREPSQYYFQHNRLVDNDG